MARIQVNVPDRFLFETEIVVRVSDLNYGGHVGNDTILTLMQEARVLFYRSLGFKDEVNIDGSVGQIISDAAVQYKAESFLGDILIIKLAIDEISKYGFDMIYVLVNRTSGHEVARAKTGIVCFDYERRKVASIPSILLGKIKVKV
jgi:YbgC/YbaW family acyl-CoA thioester hydrolase